MLRHRNWLAQENQRRARRAAVEVATRRLAIEAGVTSADLVAGQALRNARNLFEQIHATFEEVYQSGEPAPARQITAFARALQMLAAPSAESSPLCGEAFIEFEDGGKGFGG